VVTLEEFDQGRQQLLDRIEKLRRRAGSPPQPLWPDGSALSGARYTPKGGPRTVYLASEPATVLQEVNAIFAIPNGPSIGLPAAPYTMC
jgi:RES domain-containing protein